eukprot:1157248-Pelagomonas_calceolata.AAC.3
MGATGPRYLRSGHWPPPPVGDPLLLPFCCIVPRDPGPFALELGFPLLPDLALLPLLLLPGGLRVLRGLAWGCCFMALASILPKSGCSEDKALGEDALRLVIWEVGTG